MLPPTKTPAIDEDELDELPPMDGDSEDDTESADEELDDEPADGGDPLDDATGEGDPIEEEFEGAESGWLEDANEADGLDVGSADLIGEGEGQENQDLLSDNEESTSTEEDYAFGGAGAEEGPTAIDGGEEGFDDDPEVVSESELPRLDAGDDDEEGEDSIEGWGSDDADESRPAWDDRAWERAADAPGLSGGVTAVAIAQSELVFARAGAVGRVDGAGNVVPVAGETLGSGKISSLVADATRLVAVTARRGVLVSRDGAAFVEANSWRDLVARGDADGPLDVALALGSLWGRTRGGALLQSRDDGATWVRVAPERKIEAIASDGERTIALAIDANGAALGDLETSTWTAIGSGIPAVKHMALAVNEGRVALLADGRGVYRLAAEGVVRVAETSSATAIAFGEGGALLVALHSPTEARAWIVRCDETARIVAEIDEPEDEDEAEARVTQLAWDPARRLAWVAGPFGLVALRPAAR